MNMNREIGREKTYCTLAAALTIPPCPPSFHPHLHAMLCKHAVHYHPLITFFSFTASHGFSPHYLINVSSAILHWGEDPQAVSTEKHKNAHVSLPLFL